VATWVVLELSTAAVSVVANGRRWTCGRRGCGSSREFSHRNIVITIIIIFIVCPQESTTGGTVGDVGKTAVLVRKCLH